MSDRDLRNLYENVRRGDEYHAPKRQTEIYRDVYVEKEEAPAVNIHGDRRGMAPGSAGTQFGSGGIDPRTGQPAGLRYMDDNNLVKIKVPVNNHGFDPGEYYIPVDQLINFAVNNADQTNVYEGIRRHLQNKGYNLKSFQPGHFTGLIYTILGKGSQGKGFLDYLNSDAGVKLSKVKGGVGDLRTSAVEAGIPEDALNALMDSKWTDARGSNIGPGEIALALIFKDVSNKREGTGAGKGGDLSITIEVDGEGGSMGTEISDLEVKGQGGRLGQQPARGGVKPVGLQSLYKHVKTVGNFEEKGQEDVGLQTSLQTTADNPSLIDILYNTYQYIEKTRPVILDSYIAGVFEHLLKPAYEHAFKDDKCKSLIVKAFKSKSAVHLKKAILYTSVIHYVDHPNHKYRFLLFIDKKQLKYAMLKRDDLITHIYGGDPNEKPAVAADMNAGVLGTEVTTAQAKGSIPGAGGFSMTTFYPNMVYKFQ